MLTWRTVDEEMHDNLTMRVQRYKNRFVLSSVWHVADESTVAAYCRFHASFFEAYLADFEPRPKFRVALTYDVRALSSPNVTQWMTLAQPFISCHNTLREYYKQHLHSTVVLLNHGSLRKFLHILFTSVYLPARPAHFVDSEDDVTSVYDALAS